MSVVDKFNGRDQRNINSTLVTKDSVTHIITERVWPYGAVIAMRGVDFLMGYTSDQFTNDRGFKKAKMPTMAETMAKVSLNTKNSDSDERIRCSWGDMTPAMMAAKMQEIYPVYRPTGQTQEDVRVFPARDDDEKRRLYKWLRSEQTNYNECHIRSALHNVEAVMLTRGWQVLAGVSSILALKALREERKQALQDDAALDYMVGFEVEKVKNCIEKILFVRRMMAYHRKNKTLESNAWMQAAFDSKKRKDKSKKDESGQDQERESRQWLESNLEYFRLVEDDLLKDLKTYQVATGIDAQDLLNDGEIAKLVHNVTRDLKPVARHVDAWFATKVSDDSRRLIRDSVKEKLRQEIGISVYVTHEREGYEIQPCRYVKRDLLPKGEDVRNGDLPLDQLSDDDVKDILSHDSIFKKICDKKSYGFFADFYKMGLRNVITQHAQEIDKIVTDAMNRPASEKGEEVIIRLLKIFERDNFQSMIMESVCKSLKDEESEETLLRLLGLLKQRDDLRGLITWKNVRGVSLAHFAASSHSYGLKVLRSFIEGPDRMWDFAISSDYDGKNIFHHAAEAGVRGVFDLVWYKSLFANYYNSNNPRDGQLHDLFKKSDQCNRNVVHCAALSKRTNKASLESIWSSVNDASFFKAYDKDGHTPAYCAAQCGNKIALQFFLEKGLIGGVLGRDSKTSLTHVAALAGHESCVKVFDPNFGVIDGKSLFYSVINGGAAREGCGKLETSGFFLGENSFTAMFQKILAEVKNGDTPKAVSSLSNFDDMIQTLMDRDIALKSFSFAGKNFLQLLATMPTETIAAITTRLDADDAISQYLETSIRAITAKGLLVVEKEEQVTEQLKQLIIKAADNQHEPLAEHAVAARAVVENDDEHEEWEMTAADPAVPFDGEAIARLPAANDLVSSPAPAIRDASVSKLVEIVVKQGIWPCNSFAVVDTVRLQVSRNVLAER